MLQTYLDSVRFVSPDRDSDPAGLADTERDVVRSMLVENARLLASRLGDDAAEGSDPLDALQAASSLRVVTGEAVQLLVRQARAAGRSWTEIGAALGVSRQAAFQRFADDTEEPAVDAPAGAVPGAATRGRSILDTFLRGRFDEMRATFDDRMAATCSAALLTSVREGLAVGFGDVVRVRPAVVRMHGGYTLVDMPVVLTRGARTGRVVFRGDGRVAGFFLLTAGEER